MKKIYQFPLTPILAILMPLFFLASYNLNQINYSDIKRALYVLPVIGIILLFICWIVFRNWQKSALFSTSLIIIFFSYGQIYQLLKTSRIFLAHHSILILISLLLIFFVFIYLFRAKKPLSPIVGNINLIFLIMVLVSFFPVSVRMVQDAIADRQRKIQLQASIQSDLKDIVKPDIYFFVLDMYARRDVLLDHFQYDNSQFINQLNHLGFVVSNCSQSNYQFTEPSLMSTLNMKYVTDTPATSNLVTFPPKINMKHDQLIHSEVRKTLEQKGYKTVAYESIFSFSEIDDADYFFSPANSSSLLNNFERMLLYTTMARAVQDYLVLHPLPQEKIDMNAYDESPDYYYLINMSALNNLDNVTSIPGPKYVFAHLTTTHDPFAVNSDGSVNRGDMTTTEAYINSIQYMNKRMIKIFETIINQSDIPPVIILESDHGYGATDINTRMKNLMAYYVPNSMKEKIYPTITPVNSFRLLFNTLFNQNNPLLPDYSFFTPQRNVADFQVVPNECK
jgi:hypothetical protein